MSVLDKEIIVTGIFRAAVASADPYRLTAEYSGRVRDVFKKGGFKRLVVLGFGKAACPMAQALKDSLSDIIDSGIVITKYGHCRGYDLTKFSMHEAGHPLPDESGLRATLEAINILKGADERTLLVCLVSGGGSALFAAPYEGITLADKQVVTDMLLKAGADIGELNSVRKHLSRVKGGRLAELAYPARIISLIISDVVGDRLDVIASGPTTPDITTFSDALKVLAKFNLTENSPKSVLKVLREGADGLIADTPTKGNIIFKNVDNIVIGGNKIALNAAKKKADEIGIHAELITSELTGEARSVGKWLAGEALQMKNADRSDLPRCMISGGETTVKVKGKGLGGRNMELALSFAMEIEGMEGVMLLSAGTDGTDGPTDAAGAIVDGKTVDRAKRIGLDPEEHLDNNDSYDFFRKVGGLFVTGPTGTNVMDVQIMIIDG